MSSSSELDESYKVNPTRARRSNNAENVDKNVKQALHAKKSVRITTRRQEHMYINKQKKPKVEYSKNWSDYEKHMLLDLLNKHGDDNIELLASYLPNKHTSQVKTYLRTISRRALLLNKNRSKNRRYAQLNEWIELFREINKDKPIDDSLPYALYAESKKCVNSFEECNNEIVDFQKAYEYLAALCVGRKIDLDERTYYFVHSYLNWFINQFDKNVVDNGQAFLTSALGKLNNKECNTQLEVLKVVFNKILPSEQFLQSKCLFKTVCTKIRCNYFKRGIDYDKKISLLRAELDEPKLTDIYKNPPPCTIAPQLNDLKFKNLPSYVWTSLFNIDVEELSKIVKESIVFEKV